MNDDTDWQTIAAALSTQLDAEREKVQRLQENLAWGHVTDSNWQGIYEKKCNELDAEREKRKEAEARYSLMQTMEADALREKVQTLMDALRKVDYYGDALIARNYDSGSVAVKELVTEARAAGCEGGGGRGGRRAW